MDLKGSVVNEQWSWRCGFQLCMIMDMSVSMNPSPYLENGGEKASGMSASLLHPISLGLKIDSFLHRTNAKQNMQ